MDKNKKIHVSSKTKQVCEELVKTVYEFEEQSKKLKKFDYSKARTESEVLDSVCLELRKILEGEVRIRGGK